MLRHDLECVLPVPLHRPFCPDLPHAAQGVGDPGEDLRIVDLDVGGVADRCDHPNGLQGLGALRLQIRHHPLGDVVHQPAEQLLPERLVALVIQRHVGMHLPQPCVLGGERQRLAPAVALVGENHLPSGQIVAAPHQERRGPGGDLGDGVHDG